MPRANVVKACGCTVRIPVFGTVENREDAIREAARGDCFECIKKKRTETAAKSAHLNGLPELRGTVRQIAWAETLRADRLTAVLAMVQRTKATLRMLSGPHAAEAYALVGQLDSAKAYLQSRARAAFWIDYKDLSAAELLHVGLTATIPPDDPSDTTHAERWARRRQWLGLAAPNA
jgi:hypothetical protein